MEIHSQNQNQDAFRQEQQPLNEMNLKPENTPNVQSSSNPNDSFDAKLQDNQEEDGSQFSSNFKINYQSQMLEDKKEISIPQSDNLFQMKLQIRKDYSNLNNNTNAIGSNKQYQRKSLLVESTNKNEEFNVLGQNNKQRRSLFIKQSSNLSAYDDHNNIVLRKTIRQLTRQGVLLKDQQDQKQVEQQDEKEEQTQKDNAYLFAADIKDLINLEQGILEHEAFQIMKPVTLLLTLSLLHLTETK